MQGKLTLSDGTVFLGGLKKKTIKISQNCFLQRSPLAISHWLIDKGC